MFLIIIGVVTFIVWVYILFVREWLDKHFQGTWYAWWHENVEDVLWAKSRTILASRLYWVGGIIIAVHDIAANAGVDWTPFVNQLSIWIPEQYRGLALSGCFIFTGIAFELLRRVTTQAIQEKA